MSLRRFNPYYRWFFPWLLDRVSKAVSAEREQLLRDASGVVLEIGAGTGTSFHCYPSQVSTLVALEPDIGVMQKARSALISLSEPQRKNVELMIADAMDIPLLDSCCDTVVCFLVLCSVADPERVLSEISRVLKPGGRLLFFEHVLSDNKKVQRWQHRLTPFWQRCGGGCQLNRPTAELIAQSGLELQKVNHYQDETFPILVSRLATGVAVKPALSRQGSMCFD